MLLFSCQNEDVSSFKNNDNLEIKVLDNDQSIDLNKSWSLDESFKIETYCKRQGWDMVKSNSGIFYSIVKNGDGKVFPSFDDEVTISYEVRLLDVDQTLCYSSDEFGSAIFKV